MTMRDRLISELTQNDARRLAREVKRGGWANPYALAHELRAADSVINMVSLGESWETAFAEFFVATRENHRIAKRLGLRLDVQRGEWINQSR